MSYAVERLVNLALYLADSHGPVNWERIRKEVSGYPEGQDENAFLRMFERDKDELRRAGFAIEADEQGHYLLDRAATFAADIELSADEIAAVRAAGAAMLADDAFPFAEDLRLALAKIAVGLGEDVASAAAIADERPAEQGGFVAQLMHASDVCKRARFGYTNSVGRASDHEIEPYGLFAREGRWYAVGRDTQLTEVRTYALARMRDLEIESSRPRTADFERPEDFDIASFIMLPFQYGPADAQFDAAVRIGADAAWRARALAGPGASLAPCSDGSTLWRLTARDASRFCRFVVENGPGLTIVEPHDVADELAERLNAVAAHAKAGVEAHDG